MGSGGPVPNKPLTREAFLLTVGAFLLTVKLLYLQSLIRPLLDALSHCKQKAPIVS